MQHFRHFAQDSIQIECFQLKHLPAAKGEELLGEGCSTGDRPFDFSGILVRRGIARSEPGAKALVVSLDYH